VRIDGELMEIWLNEVCDRERLPQKYLDSPRTMRSMQMFSVHKKPKYFQSIDPTT